MKDWWEVDADIIRQHLLGVPGWRFDRGKYRINRNHLPLISEALRPKIHTESSVFLHAEYVLRPYQQTGRNFMVHRRGTLLGDQQRLGKTVQIVSAHDPADGKLIVVGPLISRGVWLSWFRKRWPDARIVYLTGREADMEKIANADCIFLHYDILPAWQFANKRIGTLVFDEAHRLSNPQTKIAAAAGLLAAQAERVVCATGTPLWNEPRGLFTILSLCNPGAWGNFYSYAKRYCNGQAGSFGFEAKGTSNEEEFQARLKEVMLRRTWEEVLGQLPDINRSVITVPLSAKDRIAIDKQLEADRDGKINPRTLIGDMARLRRIFGEYKLTVAVDTAINVLRQRKPVVLWTWHKDIAEKLDARLSDNFYAAHVITGETPEKERNRILEFWRGSNQALIISMGVGQTAIDLSHAKDAIFVELDYTPTVVSQAEYRTYAMGQPMNITYLTTDHAVEMSIVRALMRKCALATKLGIPAAESAIDLLGECLNTIDVDVDSISFLADLLEF